MHFVITCRGAARPGLRSLGYVCKESTYIILFLPFYYTQFVKGLRLSKVPKNYIYVDLSDNESIEPAIEGDQHGTCLP